MGKRWTPNRKIHSDRRLPMNAVGIDVSKGKSMVAVMQPLGVVIAEPFEVNHTEIELGKLARFLKSLSGDTKVIMKSTGHYNIQVADYLHDEGIFVTVVNPILIANYDANITVRKAKTDKKDSIKIANWGIEHWLNLVEYIPSGDIRKSLKIFNRQYNQLLKQKTMGKNNLIAMLDQTFPDVHRLFSSPQRPDGREKWLDFCVKYWHCECVCGLSQKEFTKRYAKWCKHNGYNFSENKDFDIYAEACGNVGLLPKNKSTKTLITSSLKQLSSINENILIITNEMDRLARMLPEYETVAAMYGVGRIIAPQLIAEIGDIYRFKNKKSLIGYAGIDAPPYQSGDVNVSSRSISKRGSSDLRKVLFVVMQVILQKQPKNEPVYQFLDKKRLEGKPYKVYMITGSNKFLRIYYARSKNALILLKPILSTPELVLRVYKKFGITIL